MSNGFWINFNPAANTVLNNLGSLNQDIQRQSEVMSTGNSVNSAADNPAAYAISQNMIMESNGLNVAVQNAQQGNAMLQTATGAQQQVLSILQTMNNLATQAAQNATQGFSDRAGLQLEMNSLAQEINSITNQTEYNGQNVLSGVFGSSGTAVQLQVGANAGQTISFNIESTDVQSLGVAGAVANSGTDAYASQVTSGGASFATGSALVNSLSFSSNTLLQSGTYRVVFNGSYDAAGASSTTGNLTSGSLQLEIQDGSSWENVGSAVTVTSGSTSAITLGDSTTGATLSLKFDAATFGSTTVASGSTGQTYQQTDTLTLTGASASAGTATNGWTATTNVAGLNIMTVSGASTAIASIHSAINTLTAKEEQLGAVQNRLNATVSDLQNSSSNLQTANSVIVGANMAEAQTQFAQKQILEQAGISVLSQVQQQPALLLKLIG